MGDIFDLRKNGFQLRLNDAVDGRTQAEIGRRFAKQGREKRTAASISNWHQGTTVPEPEVWQQLADSLRVNVWWLILGLGEKEGPPMTQEAIGILHKIMRLSPSQRKAVVQVIESYRSDDAEEPSLRPTAGGRRL